MEVHPLSSGVGLSKTTCFTVNFLTSTLVTRATIYKSLRALRARDPKKSRKASFWEAAKKVPENTRKHRKIPEKYQIWTFWGVFDFSCILEDFFADAQKDSFRDFFGISGPEVNGRLGRNSTPLIKGVKVRSSGSLLSFGEPPRHSQLHCNAVEFLRITSAWTWMPKSQVCREEHSMDQCQSRQKL